MTVAQLERSVSSAELTEWMAFERIEPWGCRVEDHRAGLYAALKLNAGKAVTDFIAPTAFFPWNEYKEPAPPAPPDQVAKNVLDFFDVVTAGNRKQ